VLKKSALLLDDYFDQDKSEYVNLVKGTFDDQIKTEGYLTKDLQGFAKILGDVKFLVASNESLPLSFKKKSLTFEKKIFRSADIKLGDLNEKQLNFIDDVLETLFDTASTLIDNYFEGKERAGRIVKGFIRELCSWNILGGQYPLWAKTILSFSLVSNDELTFLVGSRISILKFIMIILNELETLFSVDKELEFFDSDDEIDFSNLELVDLF
jgi:hypothetical protein